MSLTIADKVQQDVLTVISDAAESDQVGAVDGGREDSCRRAVGASVVGQYDVEADDAVLAGAW